MKKVLPVILCLALCLTIAFLVPQMGTSNPNVDDTGCTVCHDSSFDAGSLHDTHDGLDCSICHETTGDSPAASSCVVCHPVGDPGACNLVNFHDPAVADCLMCHPDCEEEPTTTSSAATTTTSPSTTTTSPAKPCPFLEIYGEGSEEVEILRALRDNVLSQTSEGQEIIRLYYQWAPIITMAVRNDEEVRAEIKELADEILMLITE